MKELYRTDKNGETQVREPVYSHEGLVRKQMISDIRIAEIDLTAQRMVFYKDERRLRMRRSYPEIHSCPTVQLLWDVIQQVK